jgi:hypothetical protein
MMGGTTRLPLGSTSVTTTVDIQSKPRPVADLPESPVPAQPARLLRGHGYPDSPGSRILRRRRPQCRRSVVIQRDDGAATLCRHGTAGTTRAHRAEQERSVDGSGRDHRRRPAQRPRRNPRAGDVHSLPAESSVAPFLVIRTAGDPAALIEPVRAVARTLDKDLRSTTCTR